MRLRLKCTTFKHKYLRNPLLFVCKIEYAIQSNNVLLFSIVLISSMKASITTLLACSSVWFLPCIFIIIPSGFHKLLPSHGLLRGASYNASSVKMYSLLGPNIFVAGPHIQVIYSWFIWWDCGDKQWNKILFNWSIPIFQPVVFCVMYLTNKPKTPGLMERLKSNPITI